MKIRNGFVSNSSSSSFVVSFPKLPESVEGLQYLLFGTNGWYANPFQYGNTPSGWPTREIAEIVWKDIKDTAPPSLEDLTAEFSGEISGGNWSDPIISDSPTCPDIDWSDAKISAQQLDAYNESIEEWGRKVALAFIIKYPGFIYIFEYCDNNGSIYAAMEHGNLFSKLPHVKISNH